LIIKKKRINSLSCLNHVEEGKNLMMVLRDAARFKGILVKLGFSEDLIEGERVLPSMLNPTLKRNAEPFYIKDKTKPKEQYTQTLWWTRHEWAGRGETREVTDFVTIPRERYARIKFEPYSVELFLKYDEQGQLMVMTDFISYCHDNEKLLINTINIFLTNFEECEILTENFENVMPTRTIKLNWEVLPSGDYPWKRMQDDLQKVSAKSSKTAKKLLIDKCEFINSFQPDFRAYGKSGFHGYVIFGFMHRNIYVSWTNRCVLASRSFLRFLASASSWRCLACKSAFSSGVMILLSAIPGTSFLCPYPGSFGFKIFWFGTMVLDN